MPATDNGTLEAVGCAAGTGTADEEAGFSAESDLSRRCCLRRLSSRSFSSRSRGASRSLSGSESLDCSVSNLRGLRRRRRMVGDGDREAEGGESESEPEPEEAEEEEDSLEGEGERGACAGR